MKKFIKGMVIALFTACLSLSLVACGSFFGGGSGSSSSSSSGGSSSGNSSGSSSGSSSQPKEDSDGTFLYTGASVQAANTSISGDITIPSERNGAPIDTIPANAFKGCVGITSITVPESVTSIGKGAFSGCSSLRSITLPFVGSQKGNSDGNTACFGYIFGTSSYQGGTETRDFYTYDRFYIPSTLRSVTITNETVLTGGAFYHCSMLTKIDLNDTIIQVGRSCFEDCSKIEEISLPSISIIPSSLFQGCISLSKFTINDSVDTIGGSAFFGCSGLSSINSSTAGEVVIPNTVTSIGASVFHGCSLMKNITLPFVGEQKGNSGKSAACFGYIFGTSSYQGATEVRDYYTYNRFYIPSTLRSVTITNESAIANGAFYNCSMLQSITINKEAQGNVGENAFENSAQPTWN